MGVKTGNPRGRPPGAKNKRTQERMEAMEASAKAIETALPKAFSGDAHALLVAVYKDESHDIHLRIDAAKAAIRYEKPALASTEVKGDPDNPVGIAGLAVTFVKRKPDDDNGSSGVP